MDAEDSTEPAEPRGKPAEQLGDLLFELPPPVAVDDEIVVKAPQLPVWTAAKARLISHYVYFFEQVTHHGTYIDGFAGPQSPEQGGSWAAEMVLAVKPPWFRHFHLCDKGRAQVRKLTGLRDKYPKRNICIYDGDFNKQVDRILSPSVLSPEATFCLLDQRTFECTWATVAKLAQFKIEAGSSMRIELFYFLAQGWLDRAFSGLGEQGRREAEAWWGRSDWPELVKMSAWQRAQAFCYRFKTELGYKSAKPWPIYSSERDRGRLMYHMIHVTDHPEAPKLMARAYAAATTSPAQGNQMTLFRLD